MKGNRKPLEVATHYSRNWKKQLGLEIVRDLNHQGFHSYFRKVHFYLINLNYLGAFVNFHFESHKLFLSVKNYFPKGWILNPSSSPSKNSCLNSKKYHFNSQPAMECPKFYFLSSSTYLKEKSFNFWDEDSNWDCETLLNGQTIQRDFLHIPFKKESHLVVTSEIHLDGFYNALRWIMPFYLIKVPLVILHSSCVVDEKGYAHLFVGKSGAGKTTIAKRSLPRKILGDDMNALFQKKSQFYVSSAACGQNLQFLPELEKSYPLRNIYFISQGKKLKINPSSLSVTRKNLFSSIVVGDSLKRNFKSIETYTKFVEKLEKNISHYEFQLNLRDDPWKFLKENHCV